MLNAGPTLLERCRRVSLDYQYYQDNKASFWMALARNQDWPNPNEPALRHPLAVRLPGVLVFAHVHRCVPCYFNPNGDIVTSDKKYSSLLTTDYIALMHAKAHFLYYEAEVAGALLYNNQSYRVIALCHKVRYAQQENAQSSVIEAGTLLTPDKVLYYEPLWVGSTLPVNPDSGTLHRIQILRAY